MPGPCLHLNVWTKASAQDCSGSGVLVFSSFFVFLNFSLIDFPSLPVIFQLSFLQNRSFTLLSLYSDQAGEPSEKCGDLNFNIEYEYPTQTLKLKIIQVQSVDAAAPCPAC